MAATQSAQTTHSESPKRSLDGSGFHGDYPKTELKNEPSSPLILATAPWAGTEAPRPHSDSKPLSFVVENIARGEGSDGAGDLLTKGAKSIDAVVAEITENSVVLNCSSSGGSILVSFPLAVIPPDLLKYGQPVRLSLDRSGGYRGPRIEARNPNRVPPLEGEGEIDKWIASL